MNLLLQVFAFIFPDGWQLLLRETPTKESRKGLLLGGFRQHGAPETMENGLDLMPKGGMTSSVAIP